jgi:hypothetical protein
MPSILEEIAAIPKLLRSFRSMARSAKRARPFAGHWHSRYQSEEVGHIGEWVTDTTELSVGRFGKLKFRNFNNPRSQFECTGEFIDDFEIVGVWRELRPGAALSGTFHLYVDQSGKWLYGLCTGPAERRRPIYSGWLLAREEPQLDVAQSDLAAAMLVRPSRKRSAR